MKHILAGALALGVIGVQAASAGVIENKRLSDGTYECSMWSGSMAMIMGNIRIAGTSYQGPAFDNKFEGGPYPYVMSGKVVLWKGPMGGLSTGGNKVAATVITNNDPKKAAFDITVMSSGGNAHTINCSRL